MSRSTASVGEGTTVKIYLPRHFGAGGSVGRAGPIAATPPRAIGAECILVVEDDDALRLYTVEMLSDLGYSVLTAAERGRRARALSIAATTSICCSRMW